MNLDKMNAKQLREYRERIDAVIAKKQAEEKAALRKAFSDMAAEAGTTVDELFGKKRGGKSKPAATAGWRDKSTGVTWAGRGRMPTNFDKSRAERIAS